MLLRMLLLLLLLFSGNIQALEFPVEIIEYIDNTKIVAFLNEGDIDKKLHWNPFEGPPPLTVEGALKAVQAHISVDPKISNVKLTGIELKRIPHHERHWHYLVKLRTRVNDKLRADYLVVLMNGKVIPGLREPETVK